MRDQQKKEDFTRKDVAFLIYLSVLTVIGWLLDVNGVGLSATGFTLAGMMTMLFIGGPIGVYFIYFRKRTPKLEVIQGTKKAS
ncbi:MAG: DUF3925 family protein [Bacilli bacterium]